MIKLLAALAAAITITSTAVAADSQQTATATTAANSATATAQTEKPTVISVRQALTAPKDYTGKRVMLSGIFMGKNGACDRNKKPVDSSDVMIQDRSGLCIYASGPIPDAFDASSGLGVGKPIALSGIVTIPEKGGRPYFIIPPPLKESPVKKKKTSANAARKFAALAANKRTESISVDKLLEMPDKYTSTAVLVTGIFDQSCPGSRPDANSSWALMGAGKKQCIWVLAPQPSDKDLKTGAGNVKYVTFNGIIKKQAGGAYTLIPAPAQQPKGK